MYEIEYTGLFKRKVKLLKKRGYDLSLLEKVIAELREAGTLSQQYNPHKLQEIMPDFGSVTSNLIGCWFGQKRIIASFC